MKYKIKQCSPDELAKLQNMVDNLPFTKMKVGDKVSYKHPSTIEGVTNWIKSIKNMHPGMKKWLFIMPKDKLPNFDCIRIK